MKVMDIKDIELTGSRDLNCLRCDSPMLFFGNYKFHEGFRTGILGTIGEMFVNRVAFDLYLCPQCGKIEFFTPVSAEIKINSD